LHIISHYVAVLMGAGSKGSFQVFPIGKVGEDGPGKRLLDEMKAVGMSVDSVNIVNDASTLFSVCFQYPDSTGGTITTLDSASSCVTPGDIESFFRSFEQESKNEVILAVPEVPVNARVRLLEFGRSRGSFNAASILSSEVAEFSRLGGFAKTDLLSVNIDEARTIAGINDESVTSRVLVESCIRVLTGMNPEILVTITDGPYGAYGYMNNRLEYVPPLPTETVSTGGAGDAFIAGVISGLCCGLPFLKGRSDVFFSETPLQSALELGTMLASLSVTSADTIHPAADAGLLLTYARQKGVCLSTDFKKLFTNEC
jgi:sugar/nucleoside kinase (ribokinase family)